MSGKREGARGKGQEAAVAALIIFAKAPIPGQVKTRLCPPLTADEAATLHGSFVLDMLERTAQAAKQSARGKRLASVDRLVACAPSSKHVFFKIMEERHGVRLTDQVGEDLGARMHQAFGTILTRGYECALLVGTDVPSLSPSLFGEALRLLMDHDLVLGPSLDGGYYLIGLRRSAPDLFTGIPWSTDQVLKLTQEKAYRMGWKTGLLPACRDVDTIEDLKALIEEARRPHSSPILSKRTLGVLRLLAERHRQEFGH